MFGRLVSDTRGNMAIMFAAAMPMLIAVAALAVDEAALYAQQRGLQAAVDLAAIHAASDPANAYEQARRSLIDSGHLSPDTPLAELRHENGGPLRVETGRYVRNADLPVRERFSPGAAPANAVRVVMSREGTLFFARSFFPGAATLRASGLASADAQAAFSIGARLARLDGGIANAVLEQLLGTSLSLSVADYNALAGAEVRLLDFLGALAGEIGLSAGTYGQLLGAEVRLAQIMAALSAASADGVTADILANLAGLIDDRITVEMVELIAAEGLAHVAVGAGAGIDAGLNALHLISAAALVADGTRQISLELTAGVPGLTGIDVRLAVGEAPQGGWYTLGPEGAFVRTAQVRLLIGISLLGRGSGLLAGLLGSFAVNLPVYAELAFAEAELTGLYCPPGRPELGEARFAVTPGVLRLGVGRMDPAAFLDTSQPLHLERANIVSGEPVTVRSSGLTRSLAASVLGGLDLEIELLGSGLLSGLLGVLTGTLQALIMPVAPVLNSTLETVLGVLGLSVGEADLRLHGLECRAAVLVQ